MPSEFKLTIKDLSHHELVRCLEAAGVDRIITERMIAEIVLYRMAKHCNGLRPIIEADEKKLKRIRRRAGRESAIRKFSKKVTIYNNAAEMITRILEKFPELKEQ